MSEHQHSDGRPRGRHARAEPLTTLPTTTGAAPGQLPNPRLFGAVPAPGRRSVTNPGGIPRIPEPVPAPELQLPSAATGRRRAHDAPGYAAANEHGPRAGVATITGPQATAAPAEQAWQQSPRRTAAAVDRARPDAGPLDGRAAGLVPRTVELLLLGLFACAAALVIGLEVLPDELRGWAVVALSVAAGAAQASFGQAAWPRPARSLDMVAGLLLAASGAWRATELAGMLPDDPLTMLPAALGEPSLAEAAMAGAWLFAAAATLAQSTAPPLRALALPHALALLGFALTLVTAPDLPLRAAIPLEPAMQQAAMLLLAGAFAIGRASAAWVHAADADDD